jgi:acetolactate synthase-1/2/3 large subunit
LLIGVGFDPVEILPRPWTYRQPIVSIAPWEMADDHVPFRLQQVGRVELAIDELSRKLKTIGWDRASVKSKRDEAIRAFDPGSKDPVLRPNDVVAATAARFAGRARVTVDAGAHMFPATILWPANEPNELLISNGLSTMGFALPAAIGAALIDRPRQVVALTGDGGLLICLGELATVARERLRIVIVVFKDASLSLIEIKQQQRKLAPAGVALGDLDWSRIAEGFGIPAWSAGTSGELEAALEGAANADGPALIEARIDRSNYSATMKAVRG